MWRGVYLPEGAVTLCIWGMGIHLIAHVVLDEVRRLIALHGDKRRGFGGQVGWQAVGQSTGRCFGHMTWG